MNDERDKASECGAPEAPAPEPVPKGSDPVGLMWPARVCLIAALVGAGYLASVALRGGAVAGCGPGSGCDRVLSSHWAYWLGLPVSLPALAVYLCLLSLTVTATSQRFAKARQTSLHLMVVLSLLVLGAALWFLLVQRLVIHAWCKFCLATHATAGLAAGLMLVAVLKTLMPQGQAAGSIALKWRSLGWSIGGAMAGLALLVIGQVAVKKRLYAVTYVATQPGVRSQQLLLHDGRFRLDPKELPLLGSSAATTFIVSVFDCTCNHCRALHPLLNAAEQQYAGQLGIITLPMPLDAACNPLIPVTAADNEGACEYARLSLAVWRAKPEAFRQFDDWLFASNRPPPLAEVRTNAEAAVGKEALHAALASRWVARQLQVDIALYQANGLLVGDARLPQLVIGNAIAHGAIENREELLALIEQQMHLRPTGAAATHASTR
jgi:uncharacterized membrane protein